MTVMGFMVTFGGGFAAFLVVRAVVRRIERWREALNDPFDVFPE